MELNGLATRFVVFPKWSQCRLQSAHAGATTRKPIADGSYRMFVRVAAVCAAVFFMIAAAPASIAQSGIASIYGYEGGKTASGERASRDGLTAAHRSLPFGAKVRVTNKRNGKSVIVRINDRGPFVAGRVIDVTPAAARALGFSGLAPVSVERVDG
jgi:rare lipoprotein A